MRRMGGVCITIMPKKVEHEPKNPKKKGKEEDKQKIWQLFRVSRRGRQKHSF